jgi:hypothetical protein
MLARLRALPQVPARGDREMRNLTVTWRAAALAAPLFALQPAHSVAGNVIEVFEGRAPVQANILEAVGDVVITDSPGVDSDILVFRFNPITRVLGVCLTSNADEGSGTSEDDFRCKPTTHILGFIPEATHGGTTYTSPVTGQAYGAFSDGTDEQCYIVPLGLGGNVCAIPEPATWILLVVGLIGVCFGRNRFNVSPRSARFAPSVG